MSEEEAGMVEASASPQEQQAAAALAAVAASAAAPSAGAGSPLSAVQGGEQGDGTARDEQQAAQQGGMAGRRHSGGSISTLEPSDWRGSGEQGLQQGAYNSSMSPSGHQALDMLGEASQPQQRGRRNARQQEQNKQAQQRYRAKRKAQFEELQRKVQLLSDDAMDAQRQRQENDVLRREMAKLKALLQAAAAAPAAAAAATLRASNPSAASLADLTPSQPQNGAAAPQQHHHHQHNHQHNHQQQAGSLMMQQGSGGFKAAATAAPPSPGPRHSGAPQLSAKQIQAALGLYYQDLQAYAASVQLEAMPTDGTGLGVEAAQKLSQLVHAGVELVKMVLQASGPDAAALLTANMASAGHDGTSPADSLHQWQVVALRVALTPDQHAALADWRRRFLQKIDDCYGRRLLHKAQLTQLPGTSLGGQPQQWVEALLLQAAESVGFSACALSCAQLDGVVAALAENLREERATACAMMVELLDRILTKVQAARFLLAGHPFCWNGLSFAHAVAAMQQHEAAAAAAAQPVPVQLEPLAQLLARRA